MASFIVNGQNVTVNFDYTAPIAIVVDTVDAAGRQIFKHYLPVEKVDPPLDLTPIVIVPGDPNADPPIPDITEAPSYTWDDLTNDQKLNLISNKILEFIQDNARGWYISEQVRIANEAAQIEAQSKYL